MQLTQQERTLSVSTPLGEDVLLIRSMTAKEQLSTLFEYELELISEDIDIRHQDLLGQPVTVRLSLPDDETRFFNGYVNRFSQVGFDGANAIFDATLVPWTWFLTRSANCRIFQEKTVPDIVKEIFREHGFTDFEEALSAEYRQWIYCVQYRETDFNFISRLLEQEGIYYYFKHEDGKHTLVLADDYSAHDAIPGYEEIPYYPPDETALRERDHISDWSVVQQVQPGAFAHKDFDFTAPKKDLLEMNSNPKEHSLADLEIFDYPGEYMEVEEGESYARIRLEEMQSDYETARAEGNARGLTVGALFTLAEYPREDQNREYLIVSADYRLQSDMFGSSDQSAAGPLFQCSITASDAQTPYRPPRVTPKPFVQGPQTAIVVGKAGEEIWTDEYGRVKIQFHWDRYGKSDENSSCWVRVSHPWAGKGWGSVAIPRIGQEVIVDFLEGDPDQPIITGRVYNQDCMPPYGLPDNRTQTGIKSRSSKEGSEANFNELRFEDKIGDEQLYVHAERNLDTVVENDESRDVGNDRTTDIHNDETLTIDANRTTHVKGNFEETVDGSETRTVSSGVTETIDAGETRTISGGVTEDITGGESRTISGGVTEDITGSEARTIAGDQTESITGSLSQSVTGGVKVTTPATFEVTATGGAKIVAPAGFQVVAPGGHTQVDNFWDAHGLKHHTAYATQVTVRGAIMQAFAARTAHRGFDQTSTHFRHEFIGVHMGQKGYVDVKIPAENKRLGLQLLTAGLYVWK